MMYQFCAIFIIIFSAKLTVAEECNSCVARSDKDDIKYSKCLCGNEHFCDTAVGNCKKCGGCFQFWNKIVNAKKNQVEDLLLNTIDKYHPKIVESMLTNISFLHNATEDELHKVDKTSKEVDLNNKNIGAKHANIKEEIKKLKQQFKVLNDSRSSLNNITNSSLEPVKELKNKIDSLFQKLGIIDTKSVDLDKVKGAKERLRNITDAISKIANLTIGNSTLNLALVTENDINFLDKILKNGTDLNVTEKIDFHLVLDKDIQNLILLVIDKLNDYGNTSKYKIEEFTKNLTHFRSLANDTKIKLELNLKRESTIIKIGELLRRYRAIQDRLKKVHDASSNLDKILELDAKFTEKYNKYLNASIQLQTKLRSINKNKKILQEILDVSFKLSDELKENNYKSVDSLNEEINDLVKKSEEYADKISGFCKTTAESKEVRTKN